LGKTVDPNALQVNRLLSMDLENIVEGLIQMDDWKTNLFVVSEKHRVVIFAI